MDHRKNLTGHLVAYAISACILLAGCGFQTYSPKPINPSLSAVGYRSHDPNGEQFSNYLIAQGYPAEKLPIKQWGVNELTLCALFFHPELDLARAQWQSAKAEQITATQRPDLGISGQLENHSRTDGGISPWTYGLSIDIPVETTNKGQARADRASSLSEAARINIAQTAWQIRNRLVNSLNEYQASLQQFELLQQELDRHNEIVAILEARLSAGLVSNIEVSNARLERQKSQQLLEAEKSRQAELRAMLASNVGLSLDAFDQLALAKPLSVSNYPRYSRDETQEVALLNRLDIRAELAKYAAIEAKLRLEIARQYPDIVLSPGYAYDQSDHIWSLGISSLITLLNKNAGLIAEARSLREVEVAQFNALQAKVIGDMEQARVRYFATLDELDKAQELQQAQNTHLKEIEKQFDAGFADRLELTTAKLENLLAAKIALNAELKVRHAISSLEDTLQRPLDDSFIMPGNIEQAIRDKEEYQEHP
ncbi:MAG TPA: TolC family protein [Methylophilaceae bacterium]